MSSILSELEELQRCLEGSTDSDTEDSKKTINSLVESPKVDSSNNEAQEAECEYNSLKEFLMNSVETNLKENEVDEPVENKNTEDKNQSSLDGEVKEKEISNNEEEDKSMPVTVVEKAVADSGTLESDKGKTTNNEPENTNTDKVPPSCKEEEGSKEPENTNTDKVPPSCKEEEGSKAKDKNKQSADVTKTLKEVKITINRSLQASELATPKNKSNIPPNGTSGLKKNSLFTVCMERIETKSPENDGRISPVAFKIMKPNYETAAKKRKMSSDSASAVGSDSVLQVRITPITDNKKRKVENDIKVASAEEKPTIDKVETIVTESNEILGLDMEVESDDMMSSEMSEGSENVKKEFMEARVILKKLNIPIPSGRTRKLIKKNKSGKPIILQQTLAEVSKDLQKVLLPKTDKSITGGPKKASSVVAKKSPSYGKLSIGNQLKIRENIMSKHMLEKERLEKKKRKQKILEKQLIVQENMEKLKKKQKLVKKKLMEEEMNNTKIMMQKPVSPTQALKNKIMKERELQQKLKNKNILKRKIENKSKLKQKNTEKQIQPKFKPKIMNKQVQPKLQPKQQAKPKIKPKSMEKPIKTKLRPIVAKKQVNKVNKPKPNKKKVPAKTVKKKETISKSLKDEEIVKVIENNISEKKKDNDNIPTEHLKSTKKPKQTRSIKGKMPSIAARIGSKRRRVPPKKLQDIQTNSKPKRTKQTLSSPNSTVESKKPEKKKVVKKENVKKVIETEEVVESPPKKKSISKTEEVAAATNVMPKLIQAIEEEKNKILQQMHSSQGEENCTDEEWIVEVLLDEKEIDRMMNEPDATADTSMVSSSDDRPEGALPNDEENIDITHTPECDSSTDTTKQQRKTTVNKSLAGKGRKKKLFSAISQIREDLERPKQVTSSVSGENITIEQKMTEMRKAISDLELIADRCMLRQKAEEKKSELLLNKLRMYESNKYYKNLGTIIKDAAPGPQQSEQAMFLLDLVLSYCPATEESSSNQT